MSVQTDIQKAIMEKLQAGTFNKVTYDDNKHPVEGAAESPAAIICNQVSGGLTDSARTGAVGLNYAITDWRFEARMAFNSEVDTSYFLLNELKNINMSSNGVLVRITPIDFSVEPPPREASHNGTKITIGLTANTRR